MSTQFKTLFSFAVNHGFYGDICPDFDYIWPKSSVNLLKNGRLLVKNINDTVYCLYEADDAGAAIKDLSGERLVLGLKLKNPYFNNYTDYSHSSSLPLYRNAAVPHFLDFPVPVVPVGRILPHVITSSDRPVDISLIDNSALILESESLGFSNTKMDTSFDLLKYGHGQYTISEVYLGSFATAEYYFDEDLFKAGAFGIVEINVDSGFYTTPPDFRIDFNARSESIKYYVVADNYTDPEFAQLSVSDEGFLEESRPQINFTRFASGAFSVDDIDPAILGKPTSKITLFKSQTSISRQVSARKNIQLSRNGDVLVSNLPAPGPDRARADFVIHVAKPM